MRAASISPFAAELLTGPPQTGIGIGHGYVLVGGKVVALTPIGRLRMPNGVESDLVIENNEHVFIGGGALRTARGAVTLGPIWNPRPHPRMEISLRPRPQVLLDELAGRGPGLTPLGDDILIGYLAGAALADVRTTGIAAFAAWAGARTTALSRTLLGLAANGWLPEAAHCLLGDGDPMPLLRFGATSGKGIAFGLALCGPTPVGGSRESLRMPLDLSGLEHAIASTVAPTLQLSPKLVRSQRYERFSTSPLWCASVAG
jgi:Protein of unknown function (DUF2877)